MKNIEEMRTEYQREELGKGVRGKHFLAFTKGGKRMLSTPVRAKTPRRST